MVLRSKPFGSGYATRNSGDDTRLPVMVPLSEKELRPTPNERARRLRKHLIATLRGLRAVKHLERKASPVRPEPAGLVAAVTRTACSLCRGYCCKGGGDDGYLDEATMARVRHARPELDARGLLRLYVELVPNESFEASCVFHGRHGCVLSRPLRSDVCNSYFCRGLEDYVRGGDTASPVIVIAGEGKKMRTAGCQS